MGAALLLGACSRVPDSMREVGDGGATAVASARPSAVTPSAVAAGGNKLRMVSAPATEDAAAVVRDQMAKSKAEGRSLIVYVGATWCEPCHHFKRAVEKGELDAAFPMLDILTFDRDRDGERLASADYVSSFIPLFAVPKPDGKMSTRKFEGSVAGNAAVSDIIPKLRGLIGS